MAFEAIFNGSAVGTPPTQYPASAATVTDGVDTSTGAAWNTARGGWSPEAVAFARASVLSQTSTVANVLTVVAPKTGLYRVDTYTVQATSTNGTLPVPSVAFTEGDLSTSSTIATVASGTATTGQGQSQSGYALVYAAAGTNIVVSTAAPTTLTYNIKARVEFLG